jgi:hypothetical protein
MNRRLTPTSFRWRRPRRTSLRQSCRSRSSSHRRSIRWSSPNWQPSPTHRRSRRTVSSGGALLSSKGSVLLRYPSIDRPSVVSRLSADAPLLEETLCVVLDGHSLERGHGDHGDLGGGRLVGLPEQHHELVTDVRGQHTGEIADGTGRCRRAAFTAAGRAATNRKNVKADATLKLRAIPVSVLHIGECPGSERPGQSAAAPLCRCGQLKPVETTETGVLGQDWPPSPASDGRRRFQQCFKCRGGGTCVAESPSAAPRGRFRGPTNGRTTWSGTRLPSCLRPTSDRR